MHSPSFCFENLSIKEYFNNSIMIYTKKKDRTQYLLNDHKTKKYVELIT